MTQHAVRAVSPGVEGTLCADGDCVGRGTCHLLHGNPTELFDGCRDEPRVLAAVSKLSFVVSTPGKENAVL